MAKYTRYISRQMAEDSAQYHAKAILSAEKKIAELQDSILKHRAMMEVCEENMAKADQRRENTRIRHENHLARLEAQAEKTRRKLEAN